MDNMRVHHSRKVKEFMLENDILAIFNTPYSPELNPIEQLWSLVKSEFKKEKLKLLINSD